MSWEWATAAIGVAGLASTYFTGRDSRRSESRRLDKQIAAQLDASRREERRTTYLHFLQAVDDGEASCMRAVTEDETVRSLEDGLLANRMTPAMYLVGPLEVARAAGDLLQDLRDANAQLQESGKGRSLDVRLRGRLLAEMATHLGYWTAADQMRTSDDD